MPTPTYVAIAKTVLTGTQADVTFSDIVGTYTDLVLLISARVTGSASRSESTFIQLNGTATNYSYRYIQGSGSAASGSNASSTTALYIGETPQSIATSNTFSNALLYFPNYSASTNKTINMDNVQEDNQTAAYITSSTGLWSNTAAITSIRIYGNASSFAAGSRFDLYGIKSSS